MVDFLRTSLKSLVFSSAKKKHIYQLEDIPTTWEKMSNENSLWKKAIDDQDTSVKAVYFHALEDVESPLHYHDYIEHIIVLKGEVKVETTNQSLSLREGEEFTIPVKTPHYTVTKQDSIQLVIWHPVTDSELVASGI